MVCSRPYCIAAATYSHQGCLYVFGSPKPFQWTSIHEVEGSHRAGTSTITTRQGETAVNFICCFVHFRLHYFFFVVFRFLSSFFFCCIPHAERCKWWSREWLARGSVPVPFMYGAAVRASELAWLALKCMLLACIVGFEIAADQLGLLCREKERKKTKHTHKSRSFQWLSPSKGCHVCNFRLIFARGKRKISSSAATNNKKQSCVDIIYFVSKQCLTLPIYMSKQDTRQHRGNGL